MDTIPQDALKALKSFNPHSKAFFRHTDGRFGARYGDGTFQWVHHQAPFGFVDAGMSEDGDGAKRVSSPRN